MSRSILALWLTLTGAAFGQAAVEAGLGASRAATSTAPAKGLGKSMAGLAGSLDKALKPAQKEAEATTSPAKPSAPTAAPAPTTPAPKFEDPAAIEPGLLYAELTRRFGPPVMSMTFDGDTSLSYSGKGGMYQITVAAGKVKTIEKPLP
jgi:hypothetical protein